MTGSPFSNVLSTQASDTTSETAARPAHSDGTESSVGVEVDASGTTHEAGQDESQGDPSSGQRTSTT